MLCFTRKFNSKSISIIDRSIMHARFLERPRRSKSHWGWSNLIITTDKVDKRKPCIWSESAPTRRRRRRPKDDICRGLSCDDKRGKGHVRVQIWNKRIFLRKT
uniref:(northern house mosquito) hypothetical protein n=1 Tax=Culex pipiens TaxID=7175 RepID=A0A8D8C7X5_CULPI